MERNKDELGEFFRMSMESFQDSPSDAVWQKIDGRLAAEVTVWSTIMSFITKYFLVFVIGTTLVSYVFYTQYKYNKLTNEIGVIKEEFENLEDNYSEMNAQYSELVLDKDKSETTVQILKKDIDEQRLQLRSFENRVQYLKEENASLLSKYKSMSFGDDESVYGDSNLQSFKHANFSDAFQNKSDSYEEVLNEQDLNEKQSLGGRDISLLEENNLESSDDQNNVLENEKNEERLSLANEARKSLAVAKIRRGFDWDKKTKAYRNSFQRYVNKKIAQSKVEVKLPDFNAFRYAYGFNVSTLNVITNSSDKRNFGLSIGLIQELKILENWSLSNSASINLTNYEIANVAGLLTASELREVPGGLESQKSIKEVRVNSQYLDFNVGVIRRFNIENNKGALFVNPSVAWQFYFPQEYLFSFVDGTKSVFDSKRFIGYFGTAKVLVGYEFPLNENVHFKLGAYGERTFVEQGRELRHRTNVGISGSMLFGK